VGAGVEQSLDLNEGVMSSIPIRPERERL